MVVGESKRPTNIMDGIENTGDVRLHDHRLRLKQRFDIVRKLGQGTYGKVQLGINKKTGQEVAIKTIKKCKIESEADLVRIRREVQIMSSVRHPNIVHIYEVFENSEKMILVMEYCSGGELYDYLSQKKVLQEDEARRLFRQIATAVYYCHIHKICHRDLKLENVLLDETGSAKIADFGLSNVFKETSLLSTFCGSPLYASPEIVKGTPYIGPEVDCWSLGVLLYTLVYGAMPFDGSNFKRLVRQISNGDYYEPATPSTASPLIRDMLTVDPVKRADIIYICDHTWVNAGCEVSCLEISEALAGETPVRLDLLLSLAPRAPNEPNSVLMSEQGDLPPEESGDMTNSASMAVEPSNSAEKRILDLVAEGGEDAIKPSPTRTIVVDNKRKLELAMSASGLQRKKERVASSARIPPRGVVPEEGTSPPPSPPRQPPPSPLHSPPTPTDKHDEEPPTLKSSATMIISPSPQPEEIKEPPKTATKDEPKSTGAKPRVTVKKKIASTKSLEDKEPEKVAERRDSKPNAVTTAAEKLTSLSITHPPPNQPAPAAPKPKKFSVPGSSVGSFKEQFERRSSLTGPEVKRNITIKPVASKIVKPKAQSEDRDVNSKAPENDTVRLQQIGIVPSNLPMEALNRGGVKKTESEPAHSSACDPAVLLQDARRSLQNSMAKLVEEKVQGEEKKRAAARDIISTAIRTGKPPVAYGRSSSAGVTSLSSPPAAAAAAPKLYRTEASHSVEDHRNRGVSVERIIPIRVAEEEPVASSVSPAVSLRSVQPKPAPQPHVPLRRLISSESASSDVSTQSGEPIKKSAREFIIPIAVEGKGFVTPRQGSLEPDTSATRLTRLTKPRRIRRESNPRLNASGALSTELPGFVPPKQTTHLVSGGESEEEDDGHMHRLRPSRTARAESVSSGEEDEEDEGFHLLTAENLFSTLLHRVRALTNRLNGEEGPGFSNRPQSLFNNMQTPFFNSPRLSRRHNLMREGWGNTGFNTDFDSMFNKSRQSFPRGSSKKTGKHQQTKAQQNAGENGESSLDLSDLDLSSIKFSDKEMEALSGLTPGLSRRLQRQLLAHLPPAAARSLRRTLSMQSARPIRDKLYSRSHSATKYDSSAESSRQDDTSIASNDNTDQTTATEELPSESISQSQPDNNVKENNINEKKPVPKNNDIEIASQPQFSTLPRFKRHSTLFRETTPPPVSSVDTYDSVTPRGSVSRDFGHSKSPSNSDRPLLSKYLSSPDRSMPIDESFSNSISSETNSILSEPSYIAAYGGSMFNPAGMGFRRHSLRLSADQPRKRISRFLRPDFFDAPPDESPYAKQSLHAPTEENLYAKHKREKELETQKVLKEIREKKNKSSDSVAPYVSSIETTDGTQLGKDDLTNFRKSLSPVGVLLNKDRSRSITPFCPILDNIKETNHDAIAKDTKTNESLVSNVEVEGNRASFRESKLIRPKSYPVKSLEPESDEVVAKEITTIEVNKEEKDKPRDSKLIRPKSYPTSSPSPEKVYVSRVKKPQPNISQEKPIDVEVCFNVSLPSKAKSQDKVVDNVVKNNLEFKKDVSENNIVLEIKHHETECKDVSQPVIITEMPSAEKVVTSNGTANVNTEDSNHNKINNDIKKEEVKLKPSESEPSDKKGTIKKKIIRKVSSKAKADANANSTLDPEKPVEKKKVVKKVKEKSTDSNKTTSVPKKKSVLQSIGQKFEKLTSTKSSSPEKTVESKNTTSEIKKEPKIEKPNRTEREHSLPAYEEPKSDLTDIKRAATITDVAVLTEQQTPPNKTTVSKVLGLFKKDRSKNVLEKAASLDAESNCKADTILECEEPTDKAKRPTSLLLNGLGRKKYGRAASDSVSVMSGQNEESGSLKRDDSKRNSLRLDFSRLPRVKKVAPTNPVIEPKFSYIDKDADLDKNGVVSETNLSNGSNETTSRSRSRSRSSFSNAEINPEHIISLKVGDDNIENRPENNSTNHRHREHEPTTPDREDVNERIRRKSFYSRFNEKKARRKSNIVGPGAAEYDPVARIHSKPTETSFDLSPTSPTYDVSPGFAGTNDLSPSTERYRSYMSDAPLSPRSSLKYDNYSLNDNKIDSYRSLDRKDFKKYSGGRSYLDYDPTMSYGAHRYNRTMSMLDEPEGDDHPLGHLRDPHKYNRTISMYSPGTYATYRPKRTRNSAIIIKESEKEPSPENILEKIRQRKRLANSTSRPDEHSSSRSGYPSKGESNGAECFEKVN